MPKVTEPECGGAALRPWTPAAKEPPDPAAQLGRAGAPRLLPLSRKPSQLPSASGKEERGGSVKAPGWRLGRFLLRPSPLPSPPRVPQSATCRPGTAEQLCPGGQHLPLPARRPQAGEERPARPETPRGLFCWGAQQISSPARCREGFPSQPVPLPAARIPLPHLQRPLEPLPRPPTAPSAPPPPLTPPSPPLLGGQGWEPRSHLP